MRIIFYILEVLHKQQALQLTCQLIEKNYLNDVIDILVDNEMDAKRLDQLLWTYRDESFLPHKLATDDTMPDTNIIILTEETKPVEKRILINLSSNLPKYYIDYAKLIEIVYLNPSHQQLARQRYKKYRENDHQIETIKQVEFQ